MLTLFFAASGRGEGSVVSRGQNGEPTHMNGHLIGAGQVYTRCGQIVFEEQSTTDWRSVTCKAKGCVSAAEEAMNNAHRGKAVRW